MTQFLLPRGIRTPVHVIHLATAMDRSPPPAGGWPLLDRRFC